LWAWLPYRVLRLYAHYLNEYGPLVLLVVKLHHEDPLKLTEGQLAVDDWYVFARSKKKVLTVGMAVGALVLVHVHCANIEVVVPVMTGAGRVTLQRVGHVHEKQRFVFLDDNRSGGMFGKYNSESVSDLGLLYEFIDAIGDVNKFRHCRSLNVNLEREQAGFYRSFLNFHL